MDIQVKLQTPGPNEKLEGVDKNFAYNVYRYPLDLGSSGLNHYIVFHINQQAKTKYTSPTTGGKTSYQIERENIRKLGGTTDLAGVLKVDVTALNGIATSILNSPIFKGASDTIDKITPESFKGTLDIGAAIINETGRSIGTIARNATSASFVRTVQQTTETVALYMPDTLNFNYAQNYETAAPGGELLTAAAVAGASIVDTMKRTANETTANKARAHIRNLSPFIANYALKQLGDFGKVIFSAGTGLAQNPMLEVLYSSPQMRSFRFDFMFWPKSEDEAREAQKIIDLFRFHQAPEILPNSGGFFLVPPSEFDVKFYYNGRENPNIPRISTCVLETIDVDYAPNGFSAYEVLERPLPEMGGTGMPVGIRMSLQFKETIILTKTFFREQTNPKN